MAVGRWVHYMPIRSLSTYKRDVLDASMFPVCEHEFRYTWGRRVFLERAEAPGSRFFTLANCSGLEYRGDCGTPRPFVDATGGCPGLPNVRYSAKNIHQAAQRFVWPPSLKGCESVDARVVFPGPAIFPIETRHVQLWALTAHDQPPRIMTERA